MAEQRIAPTGQNRSKAAALLGEVGVANGVDATVETV
jgi:hypothetical protein